MPKDVKGSSGRKPPEWSADHEVVKLTGLEDARQPQLQSWIEQAARTPGWT